MTEIKTPVDVCQRSAGNASCGSVNSCPDVAKVSQNSYNSVCTAESVDELSMRLEEIARLNPPGPMNQVWANSCQDTPAQTMLTATEISMAITTGAPMVEPLALQPFLLLPAFPFSPPGAFTLPTGSEAACNDLEAHMPTSMSVRKRDRSRPSRGQSICISNATQSMVKRRHKQGQSQTDTGKALPAATDEVWEQRVLKRNEAVDNMKSSPIYYEHQNIPRSQRPRTPVPSNRNLSKRDWETEVAKWRSAWREIAGVLALREMGFNEKDSQDSWGKAAKRIKKAQEQQKRLMKNSSPEEREDRKISQELAYEEHKRQAIAILLEKGEAHMYACPQDGNNIIPLHSHAGTM